MRSTVIAASVLVLLTSSFVASAAQRRIVDKDREAVASANNAFACDLYSRLASQKGNLFFSPYSIDTALAMTYAGARGDTAQQMARTLHFPLPPQQLNTAFSSLIRDLNASGRSDREEFFQLVVANALWGQKGYPFDQAYQAELSNSYQAGLHDVDFKESEAARREINAWVEKQTREKIKDLIPPGTLDQTTRLVLTNAVYFKSAWADEFRKSATKKEPFRLTAGQTATVAMMQQLRHFRYAENEQLQVLELPYRAHRLSMVILLPRKVDGLGELEKNLTADNLGKWIAGSENRRVEVSMPKFKITCEFNLPDALRSMGMVDAFIQGRADFSGIATVEKLCIAAVIHKAYVDVNEEGTEAAAATAVVGFGGAPPAEEQPVVFKADHPFIFAIRHQRTGAILFLGRVVQP